MIVTKYETKEAMGARFGSWLKTPQGAIYVFYRNVYY